MTFFLPAPSSLLKLPHIAQESGYKRALTVVIFYVFYSAVLIWWIVISIVLVRNSCQARKKIKLKIQLIQVRLLWVFMHLHLTQIEHFTSSGKRYCIKTLTSSHHAITGSHILTRELPITRNGIEFSLNRVASAAWRSRRKSFHRQTFDSPGWYECSCDDDVWFELYGKLSAEAKRYEEKQT